MKLAGVLKFIRLAGRTAIGTGLATAGAGTAMAADEWIAIIGATTALIGTLSELIVKGFEAWAIATGRLPKPNL